MAQTLCLISHLVHPSLRMSRIRIDIGRNIEGFTMSILNFMLSCLVQARGIDVQQVSLVINYDLPGNRENYIHRLECMSFFFESCFLLKRL